MTDTTQTTPDQTNPDQATRDTTPDTSGIPAPVDIYGPQPAAYRAMVRLEQAARDGVGDDTIFELVKLRASQINGCGYCVDMHSKDLLAGGETPQRLVLLDAWREAPSRHPGRAGGAGAHRGGDHGRRRAPEPGGRGRGP